MRIPVRFAAARVLLAVVLAQPAAMAQGRGEELLRLEPVLLAAVDRVAPSVVLVETFGGSRRSLAPASPERPASDNEAPDEGEKKDRIGPLVQPGFLQAQGATTGVVLSADGWILVSRFALNFDPSTVLVTLADGRTFEAERGGEDTSRGLALVRIDATDLPVPEFVPPAEVRVGSWAIVLGRTFGRSDPSVHLGIVSATDRLFGRALQTDAYTSPANYGGPVIDIDGRVLGISVPLSRAGRDAGAELYDSGIGFAATVADIGPQLERMRAGEVLHRAWLGVTLKQRYLGPGALVQVLAGDGAPAAAAGLAAGDLIVAVDGVRVRNNDHLQNLIGAKLGGDPAHLEVVRADGRGSVSITVFLADLPAAERAPRRPDEEAGVPPWEEGEVPRDR
jgi:serine protease Do